MSDKLNRTNLRNWKKGDLLEAKKLQEPVDTLKKLSAPSGPNQEISKGSLFQTQLFRVVRLETDVIICNATNGITYNEDEEIKVSLPYLLRKTPFDSDQAVPPPLRDGRFKYTWTFTDPDTGLLRYDKRTSIDTENDDDEEIQVIVGKYDEGDLITACKGVYGGNGVFADEEKTIPIIWQDMNLDGRFWAESAETEEEE